MGRNDMAVVQIDEVLQRSPRAIQCRIGESVAWLALSMIDPGSEIVFKESSGQAIIPRWLARQKRLEYHDFT